MLAIIKNVNRLLAAEEMTTFYESGTTEPAVNFPRGVAHVLGGLQLCADQNLGLAQIWRDQRGEWQQFLFKQVGGGGFEETSAAGGNHNRVYNHRRTSGDFEKLCHHLNDIGGIKHPGLHRSGRKFRKNGLQLLANQLRRRRLDRENLAGILGCNTSNRARAMDPERNEGLQIRLNSRAAATVGTGDCERNGDSLRFWHADSLAGTIQ